MLYEQVDTAVIDGETLPWVPFTPFAENVLLKYFKLDPIRGEWIVIDEVAARHAAAPAPPHRHGHGLHDRGQVEVQGARLGRTPGSIVYETAASTHTPEVVSTGGESGYVVTLVQVTGDLLFLDENDNVVAIENWKTGLQRYLGYCKEHGIAPKDLTAFK